VTLASTVGEGTTLTLILPRATDPVDGRTYGDSAEVVDPTEAAIRAAKARALARAAAGPSS
jgi:hypothetical protein